LPSQTISPVLAAQHSEARHLLSERPSVLSSVRPSVCNTQASRRKDSRYRHKLYAIQ